MTPLPLFTAAVTHPCARCPGAIRAGEMAAWLDDGGDGELLCVVCADAVEREAA